MRRLIFAFCCAASTLAAQPTRARIGLPGFQDMFPIEAVTVSYELNAPIGKSYAAVKAAFGELKVPISVDDSPGGIIGNMKASARTSFAGYKLSRVLDCGMNNLGQNADSFRVTLAFLALLDPVDESHTKLRVGFVAGAEPLSGSSRNAVSCGSTGVIEAKLVELASKNLK